MIAHAGCHQIAAGRPRRTAGVHSTFAGRSEVAGGVDREVAAPVGRPPRPSLRGILRDLRAVATGPGDVRDGHRRAYGKTAPARGYTRRQAKAQADPRSYSARGSRTEPGQRRVCSVRWQAAQVRRRRDRRVGIRPWPLCREPHCSAPDGLLELRLLHPSPAAVAANRARASRPGPAGACAGQ